MEYGPKSLRHMEEKRGRSRRIRIVVSDMDGSFLNENGLVSSAGAESVKRLEKAGIRFAVCTGRSYEEARGPLEQAGIQCDMIAMNGAAFYDHSGAVCKEHTLSRDSVRRIFDAVKPWRDLLILQAVTNQGDYIMADEEIFRHFFGTRIFPKTERTREEEEALFAAYHRTSAEEFLKTDVTCYKIVTLSEDTALIREIKKNLKLVPEVCVAASFPTNWEITHERASKGAGLADYAELCGCTLDQVMAVGDGDNDRTMLSLPLGWSVAMGNAGDALKETADIVTKSNREEGFCAAVNALLAGIGG